MSNRGANVTVTIGAAFAGSFKSVLREADRELRSFGKRGSRTMKGFDKAAKGAGKSVAATAKAAREAGSAIGALHRELPALRMGAKHTATAAREMRTLARDTREATKAHKAQTATIVRGAKARAQARAARSSAKALAAPGSTTLLSPVGSRRTRSGVPAVARGGQPPASRPPRGGAGARGGSSAARRAAGGGRRGGSHAGGHGNHDAAAIVGGVGAAVSAHGIWDMLKSGGEVNDMQVLLKLQGRTAAEIADTTKAAQRIAADNPAISLVEAFKTIIDVADTGDRDMKKAARLAPVIAQSAKMVSLVSDDQMRGHLGEGQGRYLGRAIEDLGKGTKSEGEIREFVDAVTAGTIATRGIFNPRELFQTIQKSGGSARGWDNEFIGKVLPAITMAMGGSGAGDAAYMFQKLLVKGQGQLSSAKALMDMGMINKQDLLYDGNKFLGIRPDAMPNADLLRKNQFEWFKQTIIPGALKRTGITDLHAERQRFEGQHANDADLSGLGDDARKAKMTDKFKEHIDGVLQRSTDTFAKAKNTSKMIADFIAQQEQIDAMIAQINKQPKNATDIMMSENFNAQIEKVRSSFHTLMSAMGAPEVGLAITAMDSLARTMSSVASAAEANPETVKNVMAAFAAVTAGFAGAGIAGLVGTVALSAGPVGLAIGVIGGALAAWAALDWDGFAEAGNTALSAIKAVGSALSAINSALGLDEDGNGTNAVGRMVSRYLGNNRESLSQEERNRLGTERDKAQAAYDATEGANAGFRGSKRASAKAALDSAQAALDELDARRERYARRNATPGAVTVATKSDPQTVIGTADAMSGKSAATKAEEAGAIKATQDAAAAHALHQDEATTKAIEAYKPKAPDAMKRHPRPGKSDSFSQGRKPISAENVAPISGPTPGTMGAPALPGPTPGAAVAASGGKQVVELAGPVAIKDDVGVKQPLRLVTPVLVSAQGVLNVHDSELQGAMSGLMGTLNSIAASSAGTQANTAAIAASCAAIAAKDFSPKITVQGGGGAGPAGASRERSSFSD